MRTAEPVAGRRSLLRRITEYVAVTATRPNTCSRANPLGRSVLQRIVEHVQRSTHTVCVAANIGMFHDRPGVE
eukprot:2262358-Heterocapsa_arctica.AAC.1